MSKFESRLGSWLGEHFPDQDLVSWILLCYPNAPDSRASTTRMDTYLSTRGLDTSAQVEPYSTQMFAVTTDSRLVLGSIGGVIGVKPKDLILDAPIERCRLEWFDQKQVGHDQRHLLFLFDEQWVRTDAIIKDSTNADAFVASLGERATRVEAG